MSQSRSEDHELLREAAQDLVDAWDAPHAGRTERDEYVEARISDLRRLLLARDSESA